MFNFTGIDLEERERERERERGNAKENERKRDNLKLKTITKIIEEEKNVVKLQNSSEKCANICNNF